MTTKKEAYQRIDRAFDDGKEICLIIWGVEDVIQVCKDNDKTISIEDAENVINLVEGHHDACYGVNWDMLWIYAEDVINQREEEENKQLDRITGGDQ